MSVQLQGTLRIILEPLLVDKPFIGAVTVFFLQKPVSPGAGGRPDAPKQSHRVGAQEWTLLQPAWTQALMLPPCLILKQHRGARLAPTKRLSPEGHTGGLEGSHKLGALQGQAACIHTGRPPPVVGLGRRQQAGSPGFILR